MATQYTKVDIAYHIRTLHVLYVVCVSDYGGNRKAVVGNENAEGNV